MKLKPSVVAVMFALSAPAAWAADSDSSNSVSNPTPVASSPASSSIENAAADATVWKYVNGQKSTARSASGADQSASSASSGGNDRSARAEDSSGNDQTAMSEEPSESDQSAAAEEENDQIAVEDAADGDMMVMATPGSRSGSFKPATLEDFRAATQDKLVVILPSGWQGSVPQLLSALEQNADAAEVLILSQDADADANDDDEEEQ